MPTSKPFLCRTIFTMLLLSTSFPIWARFLSPDPVQPKPNTGENFNRYYYANNSPYKFKDPDGRDVVFSVNPSAAGGNGHTSLYFQSPNGKWYVYNQGAAGDGGSSGQYTFVSGRSQEAGASINNVSARDVPTDGLRINTTKQQDAKITMSAVDSMKSHNDGTSEYNLYSNNCTDAAVDVVNNSGAGITVSNPATTVSPNAWINDVKDDKNSVKIDPVKKEK